MAILLIMKQAVTIDLSTLQQVMELKNWKQQGTQSWKMLLLRLCTIRSYIMDSLGQVLRAGTVISSSLSQFFRPLSLIFSI